jgi:hypothetical protein
MRFTVHAKHNREPIGRFASAIEATRQAWWLMWRQGPPESASSTTIPTRIKVVGVRSWRTGDCDES